MSIIALSSECIYAWAKFFPEKSSKQPTKFMKLFTEMESKGYQFTKLQYYN